MASVAISCRAAYCFNTISSATASNSLFPRSSTSFCSQFSGSPLGKLVQVERKRFTKTSGKIYAVATVTDDIKEYTLSSWAEFEIGQSSVYWRTENGLPPMAGEKLTVYYNPVSSKLAPNPEYGIAFNGGFNQPIMCGGEPRAMSRRDRGKVSDPLYMIKILVPKHALTLIFSFTDGTNWDGPYKLRFEVPAKWRNKPISFFNE